MKIFKIIKKSGLYLLLLALGVIGGFLLIELICYAAFGNPHKSILKNKNFVAAYEVYTPFFSHSRDSRGNIVYTTLHYGCLSQSFFKNKNPKTKRVFILGESTANTFGQSKDILISLLNKHIPGYTFEVIDCGVGGYDGTQIIPIAKEIMNYYPDMLLVFMGNNIRDPDYDMLFSYFFSRTLYENSWIMRKIYDIRLHRIHKIWPKVYRTLFLSKNYEEIIRIAQSHNVPIVLFKLPENKDCPPVKGYLPFSDKTYATAMMAMDKRNYHQAYAIFSLLKKDPQYSSNPMIYYYMGKTCENLQMFSKAKSYYQQALLLDAAECDEKINGIISSLGKSHGCIVIDIPELFAKLSPHGLTGDDFFVDNCHWLSCYNELIMRELIKEIYNFNLKHSGYILAGLTEWNLPVEYNINIRELAKKLIVARKVWLNSYYFHGVGYIMEDRGLENTLYYFLKTYKNTPEILINLEKYKIETLNYFLKNGNTIRVYRARPIEGFDKLWYLVLLNTAETFRRSDKFELALEFFTKCIKLDKTKNMAYYLRGLTYYEQKNYEKAKNDWVILAKQDNAYSWLLNYSQ